jgi:hypothetical protein
VGSIIESGKEKVVNSVAELLRRAEEGAEPIDPIPPKRRAYLIEFVLLMWLFSVMV